MRRVRGVLILGLLSGLAFAQTDLGSRLRRDQVQRLDSHECATTPSQTYPCLQNVILDNVHFSVVGYESRTRRITYLLTDDKHFVTKDGWRVGSVIEVAEDKLLSIPGWNIYGPKTKDGWHMILGSALRGSVINSADGGTVDPSKPVPGRVHRFKVVELEKGGI